MLSSSHNLLIIHQHLVVQYSSPFLLPFLPLLSLLFLLFLFFLSFHLFSFSFSSLFLFCLLYLCSTFSQLSPISPRTSHTLIHTVISLPVPWWALSVPFFFCLTSFALCFLFLFSSTHNKSRILHEESSMYTVVEGFQTPHRPSTHHK